MATALPLTDRIRQDKELNYTQKILEVQLGDSYREVTADGVNSKRQKWTNVGWDHLTGTDLTTATGFFDSVGYIGYITWTPPGYSSMRFRMVKDSWKMRSASGIHYNISFDLQEE